jgi:predicted site-specific integrase-resolvase
MDLRKACPGREMLFDIGSERRNFERLLERAFEGDIEEIAITHKDRLFRISFYLVEFMLNKLGVKIKVVVPSESPENEGDSTRELTDDLLSIITVFVERYHGKRATENRRRRKHERATEEEDQNKYRRESASGEDNHDPSLSRQESKKR